MVFRLASVTEFGKGKIMWMCEATGGLCCNITWRAAAAPWELYGLIQNPLVLSTVTGVPTDCRETKYQVVKVLQISCTTKAESASSTGQLRLNYPAPNFRGAISSAQVWLQASFSHSNQSSRLANGSWDLQMSSPWLLFLIAPIHLLTSQSCCIFLLDSKVPLTIPKAEVMVSANLTHVE